MPENLTLSVISARYRTGETSEEDSGCVSILALCETADISSIHGIMYPLLYETQKGLYFYDFTKNFVTWSVNFDLVY